MNAFVRAVELGGFSTAAYDYGVPLTAPFERDVYILPRADNSIYALGYFYEDLISPPFTQANNELLTETPYLIAADANTDNILRGGANIARFLIGSDEPDEIIRQAEMECAGLSRPLARVLFPNLHPMLSLWDEY